MKKLISISNKSFQAAILFAGLIYLFYYNYSENSTNLHDKVSTTVEMQQTPKREDNTEISQAPTTEKNEQYLHNDLYNRNLTLINMTNFKFVINNDICNVRRVTLVTIVHSAVDNHESRSMIRYVTGK